MKINLSREVMMNENEFTEALVARLKPMLPGYEVSTKKALLYSLTINEAGNIQLGLNGRGEPIRGGGTEALMDPGFAGMIFQRALAFDLPDHGLASAPSALSADQRFSALGWKREPLKR